MYEFALFKVLKEYGIDHCRIYPSQKGYRNEIWPILTNDGQMLNVTFYKREPGIVERIHRADAVSEYLAQKGMPTKVRADQRILSLKNENSTTYINLYKYLPGNTIPWESYSMKRIKLLGLTMSNMHANLSAMPYQDFPSVYDEYLQIIESMSRYFLKKEVDNAVQEKLQLKINLNSLKTYVSLLKKYQNTSNQQVLHMDFVRGNILFEGDEISGILDFEKTSIGHPIMDIARTLAFLLVDCKYKTNQKVEKYFLYSGYQKRGQNKDIGNDKDRSQLVKMFLFYDFYKFLVHNPYESLYLNEHYVRTRDMLVKCGVLLYR